MITITAAAVGFVLLVGLMALGLHVAFVMFAISMLGAMFYLGWPATLEFGTQYWGATNNFVLVAIPLFVLLGELLVRGGFTDPPANSHRSGRGQQLLSVQPILRPRCSYVASTAAPPRNQDG